MKNKYRTKDFYLTSYLLSSGFTLSSHFKTEGLTIFEFEESVELLDHIQKYYGFSASVNPITYGNAMRTLKSIIHENTNGTEQYYSRAKRGN